MADGQTDRRTDRQGHPSRPSGLKNYMKHKVFLKNDQINSRESKSIYRPVQNEAIFALEKIYLKQSIFQEWPNKPSYIKIYI